MPAIANRPACILIVDDERDNREVMEVILAWEGFVILTACSGEEALATLARERLDLVLLDVMMPGMTGYQVVAEIKGNVATKDVPVLMVSALADRHSRELGMSAGADDYLGKPIDRAELVLRVRSLLNGTREAPPASAS